MKLSSVHFSKTRLAGGPWRLVHALREHTDHDVRLVDLKRWGKYHHDIVFEEEPEIALELAEQADIIQFHNYLDYHSDDFAPINFDILRRRGKAFVRQFRTDAPTVAKLLGMTTGELLNSPIPSIVIAQYPERFYPQARVVPNVVPIATPEYQPSDEDIDFDLLCTPSKMRGAWTHRWATKGGPEVAAIMERVARRTNCTTRLITGRPLTEVLAAKRRCRILIDDLVTGSYHVSGLEAMALAKPAVTFLDSRTETVLRAITGTAISPFINVRLEDAEEVLVELVKHPQASAEWGRYSRAWIEQYWSEVVTVPHYDRVYHDLLQDPTSVRRQHELQLDTEAHRLTAFHIPDAVHRSRRERSIALVSRPIRTALALRSTWRRLKTRMRRLFPAFSSRSPSARPQLTGDSRVTSRPPTTR